MLVWPPLVPIDRHPAVRDTDEDVAGLESRHGRGEHDPIDGLIETYRQRLGIHHPPASPALEQPRHFSSNRSVSITTMKPHMSLPTKAPGFSP